jgi:outer membrane protein OmpA-like peptidoglycan-associated protein
MVVLLSLFACTAIPALAGDQTYKSSDIVAFFEKQKELRATRGICVGTAEDCAAAEVKDHTNGFDLLINFKKGSAELSPEARANLIEFSVALHAPQLSSTIFAIDGFTDASGSVNGNLLLSQRRALSVVTFLRALGVKDGTLVARGWGQTNFRETDPFDPLNRRVESRILQ